MNNSEQQGGFIESYDGVLPVSWICSWVWLDRVERRDLD